jgi:hypothetical protein
MDFRNKRPEIPECLLPAGIGFLKIVTDRTNNRNDNFITN